MSPVFFLLFFGILEFGGLFRDYLTLNNATASAARAAAIEGNNANADYHILQGLKKSSRAIPQGQILQVVVYHATDATTPVPAGCKSGIPSTGSGAPNYSLACNVYTGASLDLAEDPGFIDCNPDTSVQRWWCPADRKYAAKDTLGNGPPDWLGIYMKVEHPWVTGLFGEKIVLEHTTVVRLEPNALQ